jgi:hypothetical protein
MATGIPPVPKVPGVDDPTKAVAQLNADGQPLNQPMPAGLVNSNMATNATTPNEVPPPGTTPEGGAPTAPAATPPATTPPAPMKANTYDPTLQGVQSNQTVSGQVNDLLKADNPLMQTARNQANEAANSKGLLNSSMAVQAGEQAVLNSALPIAGADASTYNRVSSENAAAKNTAGQFNAGSQNQFNLSAQQAGQEQALQKIRGDQAVNVANIEANYKTLMQTNASAASVFNEYQKTISTLLDDPNTTAEQKQAAVDKQTSILQATLAVMGGVANLDLAGLLDFSKLGQVAQPGTPGAPPSAPPGPGEPGYVPPSEGNPADRTGGYF